jgi:hypothetical protein
MSVNASFHCGNVAPSTSFEPLLEVKSASIKIEGPDGAATFFVNPDQWTEFGSNLLDLGMALLKASRERTEARPTCSSEPSEPASS